MASSKEYLEFILDGLSGVEGVSHRAMMGEYILYCRGKIVGGIYDDRLLVKPTAAARRMLPDAPAEKPYEGAKDMLLVEDVDRPEFLAELVRAICEELDAPKPKRKAKQGQKPCRRQAGGPCFVRAESLDFDRDASGMCCAHGPSSPSRFVVSSSTRLAHGRDGARPSRKGNGTGERPGKAGRAKTARERGT